MSLVNRIRLSRKSRSHTNRIRGLAPRTNLVLQTLEERAVPAVFTVINTADSGAGSLRQAILNANASTDPVDTVDATGISGTIFLTGGEMQITGNTIINGPGANLLTIDAGHLSRHFVVSDDFTTVINVSMSGMTLINGQAPTPPSPNPTFISGTGGSIYVRNEKLTLDGMVLTGNSSARNYNGGAIGGGESAIPQQFNSSGQGFGLTVNNSEIDNNVAPGVGASGGAIYFSFPNSGAGFPGAYGNIFTITNSTVANNTAGKRGGGIYFSGNASTQNFSSFAMRSTTVSSNKSLNEFAGGVIISSTTGMPMSILNSTITNNTGMATPGGGGLVLNTGSGTLNIEGSIIADNSGGTYAPDILASSTSINLKNSLIGTKTGITSFISDQGGNYFGSARLGPLTSNGGSTLTHLPSYSSAALNPGSFTATTLAVAMGTSDTTMTVASAATLSPSMFVRVDSEVMLISAISGSVLTVTRAQGGTSAATHAVSAAVNGFSAITTMSAAVAASDVSIKVSSAFNLSVGTFISIESELMQITAIGGSTITVNRAQFGTTAVAHGSLGTGVNLASTVQATLGPVGIANPGDTSAFVLNSTGIVAGSKYLIDNEIVKVSQVGTASAATLVAPVASSSSGSTTQQVAVTSVANLASGMLLNIDSEVAQIGSVTNIGTTKVAAPIQTTTATGITLASTTGITTNMVMLIDSEYVLVTAINNVSTTLSSAITTAAQTSITVTNAVGISNGMILQIDQEYVTVSAISGGTLTVTRGSQGSTAATHSIGAGVTNSVTVTRAQNGTTAVAHAVNAAVSLITLTAGLSASATSCNIALNSSSTIQPGHYLLIDSEYVLVTAVIGPVANVVTLGITRGQGGTTATSHSSGAAVSLSAISISRGMFNTTPVGHSQGATLFAPNLSIVRGQDSTTATSHNGSRPLLTAFDQRGIARAQGSGMEFGSVEVNPVTPAAIATAASPTAGSTTATFTITYTATAPNAIDVSTVMGKNDRVHVVGPNGYDQPAIYVTIDDGSNGSPRTATYTFAAPGGTWDYQDNGLYSIVMVGGASSVLDTPGGNAVPATIVGTVNVALGRTLIVTNAVDFDVITSLTVGIFSTDTSCTVTDATGISIGSMLLIDAGAASQEYVLVTGVSGTTLTIARGQYNTAPSDHFLNLMVLGASTGTLRDAINQANLNKFATDTITFNTGAMGTSTVFLNSAELLITDPVVINGGGTITVDGNGVVRVFHASGPGNMVVSFTGLTVNNGNGVNINLNDNGIGSGILGDDENVTLTNCKLTGNVGGGVAMYAVINWGSLTISGCTIDGNTGGGVVSGSSPFGPGHDVVITNSSITNNTGSGFSGRTFSFNMSNTTIAGNSGATNGGGINIVGNFNSKGNSIINSTITGNSAANAGGGIYMYWSTTNTAGQRVLIGNTTIVGNFTNGGFQNKPGGGVNNQATTNYLVDFENTVIASNTNSTVPDLFSKSRIVANNSLIGVYQGNVQGTNIVNGPVQGVNNKLGSKNNPLDPMIKSLANNGGPTLTMLPYAGSPLVDASFTVPSLTTLPVAATTSSSVTVASQVSLAVGMYVTIDNEVMRVSALTYASSGATLTAAINNTVTTGIAVSATTNFIVGEYLTIDTEIVQITAKSASTIDVLRGQLGTTAAAHASAASLLSPVMQVSRGQLGTTAVAHVASSVVTIPYTQPANDQAGQIRARGGKVDIGAVEVDPNIPSAVLASPIPTVVGLTPNPVVFNVTFADDVAIDVSTILNNANSIFRVQGPNAFNVLATYVPGSISNNTNGTPRTASFQISAPNVSGWTTNDNGFYTIAIDSPSLVTDTNVTPIPLESHVIGGFHVGIQLNLIVTNDNDSGAGSLRDAISLANANAGVADAITFDASFFSTPRTIMLTGGDLYITDAVSITGPGAGLLTLQGVNYRIFTIDTPDNQQAISLSGMTMTSGNGASSVTVGVVSGGGAVFNQDEAVTVNNCVITKNDNSGALNPFTLQPTTNNFGGGILLGNALATLTLQNSTIGNNTANGSGGGISIRYGCLVNIDNCTISGNVAGFGIVGSGADGGGISAALGSSSGTTPTPTITLTNSSIINNTAPTGGGLRMGGGVSNSRFAILTVVNCTISGNLANSSSSGTGGGISLGNSLNFTIQNCTITGNYAKTGGGGVQMSPAGFNSVYGVNNGAFINCIIAGNFNRISPDLGGGNSTTGFSMSFVNSIVGAVDQSLTKINNVGSLIGTLNAPIDPQLSPLTTNGGSTLTQAPRPGSPAINGGTATPVVTLTTLNATTGAMTNSQTTMTVTSVAAMLIGTYVQIDSEIMLITAGSSGNPYTVLRGQLSTTAAPHNAGAPVLRASFLAPPANDQRGSNRQVGTIDIGAVEVNPAVPVATGTFATVTTPTVGVDTFTITYTDDAGISLASILNNNKAVRVTGPSTNVLATFVSATPGNGSAVETVTYSFTPVGGGWSANSDGFYTISIEPGQVSDGSNFVLAGTVGTLQVAIPQTFVVSTADDIDDGIYTPGNLSIREALKLANASVGTVDLISFDAGLFNTPQNITLTTGELSITDPVVIKGPGAAFATIDAAFGQRLLNITMTPAYWGSTVSISGLSFTGGRNVPSVVGVAAGITDDSANLTIDSCDISGNSQSGSGGALALSSLWASLTLKNSHIHDNAAGVGAGLYVGNNGSGLSTIPNTVPVTIQNCVFESNFASQGGALAGLGGASVFVDQTTFNNNFASASFTAQGGAIFLTGIVNFTMQNSTVMNNSAIVSGSGTAQGGALFLTSSATAILNNNQIFNNTARGDSTGTATNVGGGGIFASSPSILTINGGILSNNSATAPGVSLLANVGGGGGLGMAGAATVTLNNVMVANNTAQSLGGGIFASGLSSATNASGTLLINGSTISGNVSTGDAGSGAGGGGIAVNGSGGMVLISNSTISGNSTSGLGGGILGGSGIAIGSTGLAGSVSIRNSTVAFNTADAAGGGINFNNLPNSSTTVTMNVLSTLVSNNSSPSGADVLVGQVTTAVTGVRYNLNVGAANTTLFATAAVTNANSVVVGTPLVSAGANLGALANNGGPTQTHRLLAGSSALNAGTATTDVLTTINGAMTAAATSFTATSIAQLGVGQRIKIDSEIMVISSISGTTVSVFRGQDSTIAAAHNTGANVSFSSPLGSFDQRGNNRSNGVTDIGAYEVQNASKVTNVIINNGAAQRSMVTEVKVVFDQHVVFIGSPSSAFTLNRVSDNASVTLAAAVDDSGTGTVVTLTFTGGAVSGKSLADGRYALHVLAANFGAEGIDGTGPGDVTAGDDYMFDEPNSPAPVDTTKIFRIFGDADGNANVDGLDFGAFRLAFNTSNPIFDFDGNGIVDGLDFGNFRSHFNQQI